MRSFLLGGLLGGLAGAVAAGGLRRSRLEAEEIDEGGELGPFEAAPCHIDWRARQEEAAPVRDSSPD